MQQYTQRPLKIIVTILFQCKHFNLSTAINTIYLFLMLEKLVSSTRNNKMIDILGKNSAKKKDQTNIRM